MNTALLKRLKRLEEVRVVETQAPFELQMGYLKERRGAPPDNEDCPKSIIRKVEWERFVTR